MKCEGFQTNYFDFFANLVYLQNENRISIKN